MQTNVEGLVLKNKITKFSKQYLSAVINVYEQFYLLILFWSIYNNREPSHQELCLSSDYFLSFISQFILVLDEPVIYIAQIT